MIPGDSFASQSRFDAYADRNRLKAVVKMNTYFWFLSNISEIFSFRISIFFVFSAHSFFSFSFSLSKKDVQFEIRHVASTSFIKQSQMFQWSLKNDNFFSSLNA